MQTIDTAAIEYASKVGDVLIGSDEDLDVFYNADDERLAVVDRDSQMVLETRLHVGSEEHAKDIAGRAFFTV